MTRILATADGEFRIALRNRWVAIALVLMAVFSLVLSLAGSAPSGGLGADRLSVTVASLTSLAVYLVPLLALLMSFDAVAGEVERDGIAVDADYLDALHGDFDTGQVRWRLELPEPTEGLAATDTTVYVTQADEQALWVIDAESGHLDKRVPLGCAPWGVSASDGQAAGLPFVDAVHIAGQTIRKGVHLLPIGVHQATRIE